jgi:hypothetical protein
MLHSDVEECEAEEEQSASEPSPLATRKLRASIGRSSSVAAIPAAQPKKSRSGEQTLVERLVADKRNALVYTGVGMAAMIVLWLALSAASNWYAAWHDDATYGRPRTFQVDARVGHNESGTASSHFIAQNLHGRILVMEMPGGDPTKSRVYLGPQLYGTDAELIPVTLQFQDVNHDGKLDMIVQFKDTRMIYINDGTSFRPASSAEQSQIQLAGQ